MKPLVVTICTFSLVIIAGAMLWGATSLSILASAPDPALAASYDCIALDGSRDTYHVDTLVPGKALCDPGYTLDQ